MSTTPKTQVAVLLVVAMGLAACGKSAPPEPPQPEHQALQRAIQEPLDKARATEAELQKRQDEMQRQIDDAGG